MSNRSRSQSSSKPARRPRPEAGLRAARRAVRSAVEPLEPRTLFATLTVNAAGGGQFTSLQSAIQAANASDTILVSPGTYTAQPLNFLGNQAIYFINKALTIKSTGGAAATILQIPASQPSGVQVVTSNVTFDGFTVNGGRFGVQVQDFLTLPGGAVSDTNNVVLRNLVVNPEINAPLAQQGHGVLLKQSVNSVVDNVTVSNADANGIFIDDGSNNIVMNSRVLNTQNQHGIAVKNSVGNQVVNNTITGGGFHGMLLFNGDRNVIRGNSITGMKFDGITATDGSDENVIANNTVVNTPITSNNADEGTGVFLNSESNYNLVFGNSLSNAEENGIALFNVSNNVIEGNTVFNNKQGGIFAFNNPDTTLSVGARPNRNVIVGNYVHDNLNNSGVNVRDTSNTLAAYNYVSGLTITNGLYGGSTVELSAGTTLYHNTFQALQAGFFVFGNSTGTSVYRNRSIAVPDQYGLTPAVIAWDAGRRLGGNYWSNQSPAAAADPSQGTTPFTRFLISQSGAQFGGGNSDRFPFKSESLGEAYAVTVTEPAAGSVLTSGTRRTVKWASTGSTHVTLSYASTAAGVSGTVVADLPDTGTYVWTVPAGLPAADDYIVAVTPKNSALQVSGAAATTGALSVKAATNTAIALTTNIARSKRTPGSVLRVGFSGTNLGAVAAEVQLDGGAWQTLGTSTSGDTSVLVTLPNGATDRARLRVRDVGTGLVDVMDGFFRLTGSATVTAGPAAGAQVGVGTRQSLRWNSPAGAALVDIALVDTGTNASTPIVTGLADVGEFKALVPDAVAAGALFRVTYKSAAGATLATADSSGFAVTGAVTVDASDTTISGLTFTAGVYQKNQTLTVSVTVQNTGTAAASAPTVSFFLSSDDVIGNGDDVLLGTGTGAIIAAGGSATVAIAPAADLTAVPGGNYFIGATVSSAGDTFTGNNSFVHPAAAIAVSSTPAVDFTVTAMGFTAGVYRRDQTLSVSANVVNLGLSAEAPTVSFFLSSDNVIGNGDDIAIGTGVGTSLATGAAGTTLLTTPFPLTNVTNGMYFVGAVITNAGDSVPSNNTFVHPAAAFDVTDPVPGGSALDVAAVSLKAKRPKVVIGTLNAKESVTATFRNAGTTVIDGNTDVSFYLSASGFADSAATLLQTVTVKLKKFAVGKTFTAKGAFSYPATAAQGDYQLIAVANTTNSLAETNKSNNIAAGLAPVQVRTPFVDLALSAPSAPASVVTGPKSKGTFAFRLANGGNVQAKGSVNVRLFASDDAVAGNSDDVLLKSVPTKLTFAAGKGSTVKVQLTKLPAGIVSGAKFLYAVIESPAGFVDATGSNNTVFSVATVAFS